LAVSQPKDQLLVDAIALIEDRATSQMRWHFHRVTRKRLFKGWLPIAELMVHRRIADLGGFKLLIPNRNGGTMESCAFGIDALVREEAGDCLGRRCPATIRPSAGGVAAALARQLVLAADPNPHS
jgi:hypothetical protein